MYNFPMNRAYWDRIMIKVYSMRARDFGSLAEIKGVLTSQFMTAQEALMQGGSTSGEVYRQFYLPRVLADKILTIKEASLVRQQIGFFLSPILAEALGLKKRIAIQFSELDPETGFTLKDPTTILGTVPDKWPITKKDIRPVLDRDLDNELRLLLAKMESEGMENFRLRHTPGGTERAF